ncbi:hypothetical protein HDK77DRAFT_67825 [Phyllosticta capitalensis]|uniref:Gamma interferon inducible lysosomal thiol reductase n=1 Tax=Phyllosticta capitalensis TaxID=121624 RepID=A0ABR1YQL8_9PEZI
MEEKKRLSDDFQQSQGPPIAAYTRPQRSRWLVFIRAALLAALTFVVLFGSPFPGQTRPLINLRDRWERHDESSLATSPTNAAKDEGYHVLDKKVPLEAHIMSKCPDARDCLRDLVLPVMADLSPRISFTLSYIGTPTDHDDGVECKHGQTECLGNMLELCAADLYPDPKLYLGFTMCLTRKYSDIPQRELVHDCALEHGLDFNKLNECLSKDDGGYAVDMLQASFERSSKANVTKSCTIRLNNKIRCIRDGGEWKDCPDGSDKESLVRDINALYEQLNSESIDGF